MITAVTLFFIIVGLPEVFSGSVKIVVSGVAIVALCAVSLFVLLRQSRVTLHFHTYPVVLLLIVLALYAIAAARGAMHGHMSWFAAVQNVTVWLTALLVGAAAFLTGQDAQRLSKARFALLASFPLYVAFNFTLFVMGFESETGVLQGRARMLGVLGVEARRTVFPTAQGLNDFGTVVGATLLIGMLYTARKNVFVGAAIVVTSLPVLFLVDSRLALIGAFIVGLMFCVAPSTSTRMARYIPLLLPAAPVLALLFSRYVAGVDLVGSSAGEIGTLNSRSLLWGVVALELADFRLEHLVGLGFYGMAETGLITYIRHKLTFLSRPELASAHNSMLQYVLDTGYLGFLIFVGLLIALFKRCAAIVETEDASVTILCAVTLYFVAVGITEASYTPYHVESFAFLILSSCALAAAPREETPIFNG